jgi:hypothetical protein
MNLRVRLIVLSSIRKGKLHQNPVGLPLTGIIENRPASAIETLPNDKARVRRILHRTGSLAGIAARGATDRGTLLKVLFVFGLLSFGRVHDGIFVVLNDFTLAQNQGRYEEGDD